MITVLSYDGQSGAAIEETQEKLRKQAFIMLPGLREGSLHATQGPRGSARFWSSGKDRSRGKCWQSSFGVSAGKAGWGRASSVEVASLNNFGGL